MAADSSELADLVMLVGGPRVPSARERIAMNGPDLLALHAKCDSSGKYLVVEMSADEALDLVRGVYI